MAFLLSSNTDRLVNRGKGNRNVGREKKYQESRFSQSQIAMRATANILIEDFKFIENDAYQTVSRFVYMENFPTRSPLYLAAAISYIRGSNQYSTPAKIVKSTQRLTFPGGIIKEVEVTLLDGFVPENYMFFVNVIISKYPLTNEVDRQIEMIRSINELRSYIQMIIDYESSSHYVPPNYLEAYQ